MEWFFPTRVFRRCTAEAKARPASTTTMAEQGFANVGAWILGRNMFGPVRGPWPDESWKGWWGEEPPYHVPVFVLTHHRGRRSTMQRRHGVPLRHRRHPLRARAGARSRGRPRRARRRRRGDGARSICARGLIDELHLAIAPGPARRGREPVARARHAARSATSARNTSPASVRCTCSCAARLVHNSDAFLRMMEISQRTGGTCRG